MPRTHQPAPPRKPVGVVVRPPVTWFGGKGRLVNWINTHLPAHRTFVDVFGGSGAVILAKPPSPIEVYNDLDGRLVNLFRVVQDGTTAEQLDHMLAHTLYARAEFNRAQTCLDDNDPVIRAWAFLVTQNMSYGGFGKRWSYTHSNTAAGLPSTVRRWQVRCERLQHVTDRMRRVQIEQDDWANIIPRYDTPGTLFYLDPPYLTETRSKSGSYRHDMGDTADHERLANTLLTIDGQAVVSGYDHPVYDPLVAAGWRAHHRQVSSGASDRRAARIETLWVSPARQPSKA